MDAKEKVSSFHTIFQHCLACFNLPLTGFVIFALMCAAFFVNQYIDHPIKESIYQSYQDKLLAIETPYYEDFYSKRLNIERIGSVKQLQRIQTAIQATDKDKLTRFILDDSGFRAYLEDKANIYFEPEKYAFWLNQNELIKQNLSQLNIEKFGLSPDFHLSPSVLKLFSYSFMDNEILRFLFNGLVFLFICSLLESYFKKSQCLFLFSSISVLFGMCYLGVASEFSPPLASASGLIYCLAILLISMLLRDILKDGKPHLLLILALLSIFLFIKIIIDYYFSTLHVDFGYSLLFMMPPLFLLGWFYPSVFVIKQPQDNVLAPDKALTTLLSDSDRQRYAQAMSAISRFNFSYARKIMHSLILECPNTYVLKETGYHLEKLHPQDGHYWPLAEARINHCVQTKNYQNMLDTFSDIQKAAPSRELASTCIKPDSYLKMLVIFNEFGNIEKAEQAFMFLELSGNSEVVKEACKLLIEAFKKRKDTHKKQQYQALLDDYLEQQDSA